MTGHTAGGGRRHAWERRPRPCRSMTSTLSSGFYWAEQHILVRYCSPAYACLVYVNRSRAGKELTWHVCGRFQMKPRHDTHAYDIQHPCMHLSQSSHKRPVDDRPMFSLLYGNIWQNHEKIINSRASEQRSGMRGSTGWRIWSSIDNVNLPCRRPRLVTHARPAFSQHMRVMLLSPIHITLH
jgi:hypothetical protein